MPKRRTRLEMYFDVLIAMKRGNNNKTSIMNAANISWKTLNEILGSLTSQGFVEEVKTLQWRDRRIRVYYDFTARGEKMMIYLKYHNEILDEIDLKELFKDRDSRVL
ncbi:MAG: winged helix-turn-helix domain-containing protein [Candidatus Bathyarchaeia archaeon]